MRNQVGRGGFRVILGLALLVWTLGHAEGRGATIFAPTCGLGVSWDSFGRGIEEVFSGGDRRSRYVDEGCYQLGVSRAREVLQAQSASECRGEFASGRKNGLEASSQNGGSACYVLGYQAGKADLDVGAREKDAAAVGSACVDAYVQGAREYNDGLAMTAPDTDARIASCYSLGWFEGAQHF